MKKFLAKAILFGSLTAVSSFAKDKEPVKPVLSTEQKLAIVTAQRDAAMAMLQAQPYDIKVQEMQSAASKAITDILKDVDQAKWKLNFQTFEFEAVPQPKAEEKPATPAPPVDEKK